MILSDKNALTIMTAPSCAGKDYLSKCLFSHFPGQFEMAVSSTTRSPREGEQNGVDYWFLGNEEFESLLCEGRFLEHVRFGDKYYGTSAYAINSILESNKFPILIVEPFGAIKIWNWCHENNQPAQFVFIDVDREVALMRFLERFIKDYEVLLEKNKDTFIRKRMNFSFDFDGELEDLIDRYSKRVFLSLYKESSWTNALPYNIRLGPLLNPQDSEHAAKRIKLGLEAESRIPNISLPENLPESGSDNPRLREMPNIIKGALSLVKKDVVEELYLKNIILKCENERLNQMEFNI